ncbi:MAG: class I SAM-dependent methyltransferase [Promethearchaeota archaeon]
MVFKKNNILKIQYINLEEILCFLNDNIIEYNKSLHNKIEENYFLRHKFHNKIISPIFYHLSSKLIEKAIFDIIINRLNFKPEEKYKIIDISCGYDSLIVKIAKLFKNSIIIANDLGWQNLIKTKCRNIQNIKLSREDILKTEFWDNKSYDLILCKNTFHHIPSEKHDFLLKEIFNVGKNVIIIEIENPKKTSLKSFIWNFYYSKFLKDNFSNFVLMKDFKKLVFSIKNECSQILFGHIETIKGNYLISCILKKFSRFNLYI